MRAWNVNSVYAIKGYGDGAVFGNHRKGKTGQIYTKVSGVPKNFKLLKVTNNFSDIGPYLKGMGETRKTNMSKDLELGYTIRVRGGIFIKPTQFGKLEIFHDTTKPLPKESSGSAKATQQQRNKEVEETYRHLLQIHQDSKLNRN